MITKNTFRYVLMALLLGAGTGCNKWLDVKPKTFVNQDDLWTDEQGFKDALMGVYAGISAEQLYGREFSMAMMDVLGANYDVSLSSHAYYSAGQYDYKQDFVKTTLAGFWTHAYKNIANVNNLLEAIDSHKDVFAPNMYELVKGEALGLRAFLHFDMLRAFGPVPATGMDKKAIPYVTKFNMEVQPYSTTREVIARCLEDLTAARALLSVKKTVNFGHENIFLAHTRNHFNYWAATGLMARIYLYSGDAANAYTHAKEVIDSKVFELLDPSFINSVYPDRIFSREHVFAIYVSNMQDLNAKHFRATSASTQLLTNKTAFINTRFETASGGSTDYRYLHLWKTEGTSATKYPAKFWMDDLLAGNGYNIRRVPVLRMSEMHYIAAEASVSLPEKIALINDIRAHRGLSQLPGTLTADQVMAEIVKEYKKEFYQEGQLFFFYKRRNMPALEGTGKPGNDALYVLPIPDDEIEFNKN
ncbi:RagB/SusD family nutrient uptake outer membrane protein [Chitinophaga lutea]